MSIYYLKTYRLINLGNSILFSLIDRIFSKYNIPHLYSWFFGYPKVKVLKSQVVDNRPINNPIQGRCY